MTVRFGRARTVHRPELDYKQWCKALLRHYFYAAPNDPKYGQPVRHLAVSEHELQLASGLATPEDARNDLVAVFRRELGDSPFQTIYRADKISIEEPPETILPVVISSLVAAEYSSEENYRATFNETCGNSRENDTRTLPSLWEHLRNWLRACRQSDDPPFSVRDLVLPRRPDTGWRNIFYALHLTFPHRRDRELLQSCLSEFNNEPTVAEVLGVVERCAAKFTDPFRYYLSEFMQLRTYSPLHPFWYAVQHAWHGLRGDSEEEATLRLCAQVVGGQCHAYLLVESPQLAPAGYSTRFAPTIDATSRYVIVDSDGNHDAAVSDLLSGKFTSVRFSREVTSGVIAFTQSGVRIYECLGGIPRSSEGIALVRSNAQSSFQNTLSSRGGKIGTIGAPYFLDWRLITDVHYGEDTRELLPLTSMRTHAAIASGTGIAYGNGFLGEPGFLPMIQSTYAASVDVLAADDTLQLELTRCENGVWTFPNATMRGRWTATARDNETNALGQIVLDFVAPPSHSEFVTPSNAQCARMMVEGGQQDMEPLERDLPFIADSSEGFVPQGALYLGPIVGAWSKSSHPDYDWLANRRIRTLTFVGNQNAPTPPLAKTLSKSAARFWRECFTQYKVANLSGAANEAYHAYRRMAQKFPLPRIESTIQRPVREQHCTVANVTAHAGIERFLVALATISTRQAGIDEAELFQVMDLAFGVMEWKLKWLILRSWLEAGSLELAIDARWPTRRYFCRRPRVVFTDASRSEAVIIGTLLPAVAERVCKCIAISGGQATFGRSLSPYAPRLLHCTSIGPEIDDLLKQEHFLPGQVAQAPSAAATSVRAIVEPERCPDPEEWRERVGRVWQWGQGFFAWSSEIVPVMLRLVQIPRQPDRYEVVVEARLQWWTQSRTWAFLAAHDAMSSNPFAIQNGVLSVFETSGAQLPLRIALALAISAGVTHGSSTAGRYQYFCGNDSVGADLLRRLLPFCNRRDSTHA